jgi:CDP-glucose 4,6-dehydratase
MLGWYLLEGKEEYADGWNFGPSLNSNVTVKTLLEKASGFWNKIEYQDITNKSDYHEANLLMLDCSKATKLLKWSPVWDFDTAIKKTIEWYKDFYENNQLITNVDLESYIFTAKAQNVVWTQ